jgi:hypothetical protein
VLQDDLDLSSEQAHLLVRLYFKVKNSLYTLATERASALITAQQVSPPLVATGGTGISLAMYLCSSAQMIMSLLQMRNASIEREACIYFICHPHRFNLWLEVTRPVHLPVDHALLISFLSPTVHHL